MLYESQIVPHQHREIQMQQSKRNKVGNTRFLSMLLQTLQSVISSENPKHLKSLGLRKIQAFRNVVTPNPTVSCSS